MCNPFCMFITLGDCGLECYIHQYCHNHGYDTAVAVAFLIIWCFIKKIENSMRKYKICDISGIFCRYFGFIRQGTWAPVCPWCTLYMYLHCCQTVESCALLLWAVHVAGWMWWLEIEEWYPLACLCSSVGGIPKFQGFQIVESCAHEQYFGQYRDSMNVETGNVGITSWP